MVEIASEEVMVELRSRVVEGKARAAAHRARMTEAQVAELEARLAAFPEVFARRVFCGPGTEKGRQEIRIFTEEEVAAWHAAQ